MNNLKKTKKSKRQLRKRIENDIKQLGIKEIIALIYLSVVLLSYLLCAVYSSDLYYIIKENFLISLTVLIPLFFLKKNDKRMKENIGDFISVMLMSGVIGYSILRNDWIDVTPSVDKIIYEKNIKLNKFKSQLSRGYMCDIDNEKYYFETSNIECTNGLGIYSIILKETKHKAYKSIFLCDLTNNCHDLKITDISLIEKNKLRKNDQY